MFIRHFPDHIATKDISILIQTKYARQNAPTFNAEKDCIISMIYLLEKEKIEKRTILAFWVEVEDIYRGLSIPEVKELTKTIKAIPGRKDNGGSGTWYYPFPREPFIDLGILLKRYEISN
jgi:hypothetical protein